MNEYALQSGDLLVFHGTYWYSYLLEWLGHSRISHVGVYMYDPQSIDGWTHPIVVESPSKQYVLHSSYGQSAETGQTVFGVHIEPLEEVVKTYGNNNIWVRKIHAKRDSEWCRKFVETHAAVHSKPYDTTLVDWLQAELLTKYPMYFHGFDAGWTHRTDRFWCSALATYLYLRLGWIHPSVEWTIIAPFELTEQGTRLRWNVPVESSQSLDASIMDSTNLRV